ncbi:MAG TPA: 4'-phosphopantetheinyl transferase superfamily protein, partial [Gemmatimonadaceae bacterium]|nr:4'-phosphopantetheinyl transferase superfamily protein [Gemmatimonadaceae bacterium]
NPKMSHYPYRAAVRGENRAPSPTESIPVAPAVPETVTSLAGGAVEVVAVHLDGDRRAPGDLAQCLCDGERLRASRFVFERDRRRFIVARARLRHLLASRLGVQPDAVELVYGPQGKPGLSRRFAGFDLRFNVSHSEDVAVYAFSRDCEIGVDVEFVREMRDADDIAARFFSRRENEAYLALDPRDRPLGFFNCWTRKEAFIKALGEGLSHPLDRFDVSLAPGEPAEILRVGDAPGHDCGWRMESFFPAAGFVAAVVTGQS